MKKAIALLALLVSGISIAACDSGRVEGVATTPASATVQHIEEDEVGWDCATMGNKVCGPAVDVNDLPACATEDAAGPCYWDATTRGNGVGNSFTVDATGAVTYLSAALR